MARPVTVTRPCVTQPRGALDNQSDRPLSLQLRNLSPNPDDISYGFDANDDVVTIAQTGTTTISYDALNRPSVRTLPSGVNTTCSRGGRRTRPG